MKIIPIEKLVEIMRQLRQPDSGCPWDIKQSYESIIPYTIEEVYEVVDAIERKDYSDLKGELGDLLFQVVFYAQLAEEDGYFDLADVVETINQKLTTRHPHVFSDQSYLSEEEVLKAWEDQKHRERKDKNEQGKASLLDDIPKALPELKRAQKIQKRVAKQGFDWTRIEQVWEKLQEESEEVKLAAQQGDKKEIEEEIGDLLFVCVNLARHYKVDADVALRVANKKFEKRFRKVEVFADGDISKFNIEELETFWRRAKMSD
ncbi:MAG: nucleoside triphosphate pyrophosphohydrolase [Kangiellaceae bacterium]|nr:nucleoside triphosphate pyrophosphohydrolase [Kangiellaceae bacterium]